MPQIQYFTAAQEALIPEYQAKWRQIERSTQPIDRIRAKAAIQAAFAVMRKPEPEVRYCSSPRAAIDFLRSELASREPARDDANVSPEEMPRNPLQFFAKATWDTFQLWSKQQKSGLKPLEDLSNELASEAVKAFDKHLDRVLPEKLTMKDIVEQSFLSSAPFFEQMGKQQNRQGDPELQETLQDRPIEDWQDSFEATASGVESQWGWIPGKDLLARGWLKQVLKSTLINGIAGIESLQIQEAILAALSLSVADRKLLLENPPLMLSGTIRVCTWLDFAFSVLNFPYSSQKWLALQGLAKYCGWIYAIDNLCLVCDRPIDFLGDWENLVDGEGELAIEFADGFVAYANRNLS